MKKTAGYFKFCSCLSGLFASCSLVRFLLIALLAFICQSHIFFNVAFAQSLDPITTGSVVSAQMPDVVAPSTPILIAPENNSLLTDNTPEFIWTRSTDNVGISYYQLYLNGSIKFNNIPTSNYNHADYNLSLDPLTDYYHLTPKNALADGSYTWKIVVFDEAGNFAESVTWIFTIDTTAPTFVITQIGELLTSISAQDLNTIPSEPLELTHNEPLLIGVGEANSQVWLTVKIDSQPNQTFNFNINNLGDWQIQLGILPRDTIITLDFLIRDLANNTTVLEGVQIIIPTPVIIIPPQATPTPTTLLPPGTPAPSPTPDLLAPTPTLAPQIVIPLLPPKEIIYQATKIPIVANLLSALPDVVKKTLTDLAPIASVLVGGLVPVISMVAVASQFGGQLSLDLLSKILQAIGLMPAGKPQGLVFDSETNQGIPFAVLTITMISDKLEFIINEQIITNDEGIYQGIKLPPGNYRLSAKHQDYLFPSQKHKPAHLSVEDFYKGEIFTINDQQKPAFLLIPMDKVDQHTTGYSKKLHLRLFLVRLSRFSAKLIIPLFIFSLMVVSFYPTLWNWAMVILYSILILLKIKNSLLKPDIAGTCLDHNTGQTLANTVIKLIEINTGDVVTVTLSDYKGQFFFYKQKGEYQLIAYKTAWVWMQESGGMSLTVINSTQQKVLDLKVEMKSLENKFINDQFLAKK